MKYVSKSDFKAARECSTKLYYRKNKYPNLKQENEFMQLLAEGGFMVGKMAQLYFPDGVEVLGSRDQEAALIATKEYLKNENIVIFEPAIYVDGMLIRADILIKKGNHFEVIEVKAKSIDGDEDGEHSTGGRSVFWKKRSNELDRKWVPYLEDIAYQTHVLKRAFPNATISPFLMLCDKSRHTRIDNLLQQFTLHVVEDSKGNQSYNVEFSGDAVALRKDELLIKIDVLPEVEFLLPEIEKVAAEFVRSVIDGYQKIPGPLTTECKKCEYRQALDKKEKNGFLECWGDMANDSPHLLDLRDLGHVKSNGEKLAEALFLKGKASLFDIPFEWLTGEKRGAQQKRQIECTKNNEIWINPELKDVLANHKYPLQFIDFETSRIALPYHVGMRPYGQVAFQWSCHVIETPGSTPKHIEWINTQSTYPNIEFAQSLMATLDRRGSIFMWWPHERSVLRDIANHMQQRDEKLSELIEWLQWMDSALIDQYKIAIGHYYHPDMRGSFSIKSVLPAVWNNNPSLHEVEYFSPYFKSSNGQVASPYDTLEKIVIAEQSEVIKEGTGAMRAYQEMMYGLHRGDLETHKKWTDLLRQYCALDTMAMVIIYKHWCSQVGVKC